MPPVASVSEIVERARSCGGRRVVVPAAETASALGAAVEARRNGLAQSVLIGSKAGLLKKLAEMGEEASHYEIVDESDDAAAARKAVALVRAGEAHVILKGRLKTGDLLRAVLHRDEGLRTGRLLSDVLVSDNPLTGRLIGLSDGGLNVAPDLAAKKAILENSVSVFHRLGFDNPKVAVLCALEEPTESMPHTLEARELMRMNEQGEIRGCTVLGPMALDNAVSMEAAKIKGVDHPVAGQADILIVPTIEAGNMLGKAFTYLARKTVGHVVEGARAPILIPSRAESAADKLVSIALGLLCSLGGDR